MKQKIFLAAAILLLLVFVVWMARDLFVSRPEKEKNQFDYGLKTLREADSVPAYTEIPHWNPALKEIRCIAADHEGKIYVGGNGGVEIFTSYGKILNRFTIPGFATCMTRMDDGNLAIGMEDHLEIWTPTGVRVAAWDPPDSISYITSVASTPDLVYCADAGKKIVLQYNKNGKLLSRIGEKDPSKKIPGYVVPSPFFDVAVSPAGDLWVVNPGRHHFERYKPDGTLVSSWGEESLTLEGFTGCCNPSHFTFMNDGAFVTSEKGIERVKIYNPDGTFRCLVAGAASFDEGTRGLDLACSSDGRILVLDPVRNQVRIFLPNEKN